MHSAIAVWCHRVLTTLVINKRQGYIAGARYVLVRFFICCPVFLTCAYLEVLYKVASVEVIIIQRATQCYVEQLWYGFFRITSPWIALIGPSLPRPGATSFQSHLKCCICGLAKRSRHMYRSCSASFSHIQAFAIILLIECYLRRLRWRTRVLLMAVRVHLQTRVFTLLLPS